MNKSSDSTTLPDLLRRRVRADPDRIAVCFGDEGLSIGNLESRSEKLAVHLQHLGVSADVCVGLFMENSIDLMVGVWGVLYAGGAYLPLTPEYPDDRLRYMIAHSRTRVIVADEALRARLANLSPPDTVIVTPAQAYRYQGGALVGGPRAGDLAYVIYTSGSTGNPKGIMIEHRSIVSQMQWLASAQGLDERRTVLQKTPLSFDAAQWEILAPCCGSRVVMSEPGAYRDPERLIELVIAHDVTTLQGVPTLLQALVDTDVLPRCNTLRQVFSGGEALPKSLAAQVFDALPAIDLINLYGPSECTINTSACTVDRAAVRVGPGTVSIGSPVRDTTYQILDGGRPVAPGETGELHIGGVQLARGYLHRPDLTAERFIDDPTVTHGTPARLYRTGDLARWNPDGTAQFVARTDNQVKLRGYRIELDEIRMAVEAHDWVKRAEVIVRDDPRTGANLVVFTQLNAKEAALMDQGNHGAHHLSKASKLQIRAQLSNPGCRDDADLAGRRRVDLPGREATPEQRRIVFARKTYRFFDGGPVNREHVLRLLDRRTPAAVAQRVETLSLARLGHILRYFGQFHSDERLLPKYGYASPGSLYATQLYLEVSGVAGLAAGMYYYHPLRHELVLIRLLQATGSRLRVHFVGRRRAIEPVYRNNIREVLQLEAGHIIGLFDVVLGDFGLCVRPCAEASDRGALDCAADDYSLGVFEVVPSDFPVPEDPLNVYVQAHPGAIADLPAGQYRYTEGRLESFCAELVHKRHVVAINQQVYQRASLGITLLSRNPDRWMRYVELGRRVQHLQMNDVGLGFMSAGYSSETGNDLPSARRIASILGETGDVASYFVVGGPVSEAQRGSEGMNEDVVHMRGPAELIKDDLTERLPHYMIPNRVTVLDALPLTSNGKVDVQALRALDESTAGNADNLFLAPRTATEEAIAGLWRRAMKRHAVSVRDDFFSSGGNSLIAVALINKINRELGSALPVQVLFDSPTIEELARRVDRDGGGRCSRLVRLAAEGTQAPVFCWPGLGGYPMNLRLLASSIGIDRSFFGVQAHGINAGETAYPTISEMAARDIEIIKGRQPIGPYTLWGYSFGARVALEAARQLEQCGDRVENVFLIAPGQPELALGARTVGGTASSLGDPAYVAILFSVFAGNLTDDALGACLEVATDEDSFVDFVCDRFDYLDHDLVHRIVGVVRRTTGFEHPPRECTQRRINAPVTIFRARGDDHSFFENGGEYSIRPPTVIDVDADHYSLLRASGVDVLVAAILARLRSARNPAINSTMNSTVNSDRKELPVPHVNIKHFPVPLTQEQKSALVAAITDAVKAAFSCDDGAISIALEPVASDAWNDQVYVPEVVNRKELLCKAPNY